ncbi:acyl-CoA dehydratase activase [Kosmotoga pacifica]|uniref:ATPase BadF/BadG/BcrA/BcrD type domain-containing protein n=1 Tax=Kosmotoga pacifica TaxID=1330330 RepID=A0A0G2Z8P6_9BACT|nr:acyl-CoA dehydratase activase [Kosmotoga pacifica]AKI97965.1 hypothetical protein IX53_09180 [Kosmotoga pacifica]
MIYYACSYVPLEILLASKLPFERIEETDYSEDPLVHRNLCGYCKATFEKIKTLDENDLFIAVDSCDAMRRIGDLVQVATKARTIHLRLPWTRNENALEFYKNQLKVLLDVLSEFRGYEITNEELIEGIETFNTLKNNIWKLHYDGFKYTQIQKAIDLAYSGKQYDPLPEHIKDAPRLAVVGGIIKNVSFSEMIERVGGELILNETCGGVRGFTGEINTSSHPLDEIAKRVIQRRVPCGRFVDMREGAYPLAEEFKKLKIEGVIRMSQKFCDFFDDYPVPGEIPVLSLEIDFPLGSLGQLSTRVGAFIEKLRKGNWKSGSSKLGRKGLFLGVDSGSTTTNLVVVNAEGKMVSWKVAPTGINGSVTARKLLDELFSELNITANDISYCIATGYGRDIIDFADESITEITCHARGARALFPEARSIVDIGGQDSKVIRLDEEGNVVDFTMNDKCAAGTGRFLEVMARVLEKDLDAMAAAAERARKNLAISSMCTVFAESEVVSLIGKGESINDISAGLFRSISKRIGAMYKRVKGQPPVVFTGGVAKNSGIVKALEEELNIKFLIPEVPDIVGAYGAAIMAREKVME